MSRLTDGIRRAVFQGSLRRRDCSHLDMVSVTDVPVTPDCGACREEGTQPVHLRMCLACGTVSCCDSSPAKHARRHFTQTGHPLIRSVEPSEEWLWCYPDRAYLTGLPSGDHPQ